MWVLLYIHTGHLEWTGEEWDPYAQWWQDSWRSMSPFGLRAASSEGVTGSFSEGSSRTEHQMLVA